MRGHQGTEGRGTGEETPLVAQVERALEGAVFPLDRERLVWVARENDAAAEVLTALSALPARPYQGLEQVLGQLTAPSSAPTER